ncbi:MAG: sulfurtransferase TusA family protein [Promethearchaeia archaeon]
MVDITETLDCSGEVCPYPDVKSKRKVKKMKSGEVLEILVDYPLSAERIPETMESLGHEVLSVEKQGTSEWRILVKIGGA